MLVRAADVLLQALANQERRVLSTWRALLLLRRATIELPPNRRRWSRLPRDLSDARPILRQMVRRGEIAPLAGLADLYEVTVPYAQTRFVEEDEILGEVNPYAAISHLSALAFHQLTDQLPTALSVAVPRDGRGGLLPMGTDASEWDGIALPTSRRPPRILGQPIRWFRQGPSRFFGTQEYRPRGYLVRVTTPERTLLDGLLEPEACGGLENVLRAWRHAAATLDLDNLVDQVERLDVAVLRQRVGYVLGQLDLSHSAADAWRRQVQRGGSSKLLASAPYASVFDERWSLSLNGPVELLRGDPA